MIYLITMFIFSLLSVVSFGLSIISFINSEICVGISLLSISFVFILYVYDYYITYTENRKK